jgi:hypothetical protein
MVADGNRYSTVLTSISNSVSYIHCWTVGELQQPNDKILGFGFVDDTNLIAWETRLGTTAFGWMQPTPNALHEPSAMAPNLHRISINLCIDAKLKWKEHIKEQAEKGTAAFEYR